jgi:hypothetical protein
VARKRSTTAAPRLTVKSVEAELKKLDFAKAIELARTLADLEPTHEHQTLYAHTLARCIDGYLRQNKVKPATEAMRLAEAFAQRNEVQRPAIAAMLARCGEFGKALALADVPSVRMQIADLCVRRNRADGAPAEIKSEFPLIDSAFRDYEAGRDEAARDTLQKLGLASPFLQWKLLLRGLIASAANEPGRAVENWQRLQPEFLPAQLAAPLRAKFDPDFRKALPAERVVDFEKAMENLVSGGIAGELRELQKFTGRDQDLSPAWKVVASLLPKLRANAPHLVPRLAVVLYRAVMLQGQPADLGDYRRLFLPPADDPNFLRLQARACEGSGEDAYAVEYWIGYERWLATAPAGWPSDLRARARAIVLHRVGGLIEDLDIPDEAPAEFRRAMSKLLGEPVEPSNFGNPDDYYRRSLELAPDWSEPAFDLFDRLAHQSRWAAAERVAVEFLARRPDDLDMLKRMMTALRSQGRHADRLAIAKRAVAVNPLDKTLEFELMRSCLATARMHLAEADYDACERVLSEAGAAREAVAPASFGSLRAILARCRKRTGDAEAIEAGLLASPRLGLAATLHLSVLGWLAGLKPAQRKDAEQRLKTALEKPGPRADESHDLLIVMLELKNEGVDYRGRATVEKKILALAERSVRFEGDSTDFESIFRMLMHGQHHKTVLAMAPRLAERFPKSPLFPFIEAQALVMKSKSHRSTQMAMRLLGTARRLAEASDRSDKGELLAAIREIERTLDPFGGRFLFGSRFGFGGPDDGGND